MLRHIISFSSTWVLFAATSHTGEALHVQVQPHSSPRFSRTRIHHGGSRCHTTFQSSPSPLDDATAANGDNSSGGIDPLGKLKARIEPIGEKTNSITSTLVPAIPLQDFWVEDIFNPRFIVREMLLGARYQCELLPLHILGAMVGNAVQSIVALWITGRAAIPWVTPLQAKGSMVYSAPHYLTNAIGSVVAAPLAAAAELASPILETLTEVLGFDNFVSAVLVAPISEEIVYRGILQNLSRFGFLVSMSVRAFVARHIGIKAAIALEVATFFSIFLEAVKCIVNRTPVIGAVMYCHLIPVVQAALLIPATVAILDFIRKKTSSINGEWKNEGVSGAEESIEWNEPGFRHFIATTLDTNRRNKEGRHMLYYKYQRTIDRVATRYSRWVSASYFAASHGTGGSFCPSRILGLVTSALLVETRLFVNRRNIFAPIGAHMIYNLLAVLMPMQSLVHDALFLSTKKWPRIILLYPFYCTATRIIAKGLMWVEVKVSGHSKHTKKNVIKQNYMAHNLSAIARVAFVVTCLCIFSAYQSTMLFNPYWK